MHAVSSKVQGTVKVRQFKKVRNSNSTPILTCNPGQLLRRHCRGHWCASWLVFSCRSSCEGTCIPRISGNARIWNSLGTFSGSYQIELAFNPNRLFSPTFSRNPVGFANHPRQTLEVNVQSWNLQNILRLLNKYSSNQPGLASTDQGSFRSLLYYNLQKRSWVGFS